MGRQCLIVAPAEIGIPDVQVCGSREREVSLRCGDGNAFSMV